jgi:putative endonuclease
MYYVYILKLKDGSYYSGYSNELQTRIKDHQQGRVATTKNNRPIKLIWYCAFLSKKSALIFEKYLKSSSGFAFRNKRLLG